MNPTFCLCRPSADKSLFFRCLIIPQVRVYNLAKQELAKKLLGSSGPITCLAVHSSGDHVLVGGEDKRLAWYDMDLSTKPYKALRWVAGEEERDHAFLASRLDNLHRPSICRMFSVRWRQRIHDTPVDQVGKMLAPTAGIQMRDLDQQY